MGNICQLDLDVFWALHWSPNVDILDIETAELGPWSIEDTIDDEFHKFKRGCRGCNFPWEDNSILCDGNVHTIGVFFLGPYFTYYHGEANLLTTVSGDITKLNEVVGISTLEPLCVSTFRAFVNPLA